jgi:hypothetical protein
MTQDTANPPLPFEDEPPLPPEVDVSLRRDLDRPMALVHILTPEFHGFDPGDFADIPDIVVARASAKDLQPSLFWKYVPKGKRQAPEVSAFSYQSAEGEYVSVALTPEEYDSASEGVDKLAQRVFNRVLVQRDVTLRQETGDETARARSEEDLRAAHRGAMRAVMSRQLDMEKLLEESILPKIQLIERFTEMTEGHNFNLARGTKETVSKRFEELRTTVFDDMLDAVALQRNWDEDMATRAKQIIQKRLYISGTVADRVANFKDMLVLAQDYYGYKRALLLTKIQGAKGYQRANPSVVADIMAVDEQRYREKEAKQLRFDD